MSGQAIINRGGVFPGTFDAFYRSQPVLFIFAALHVAMMVPTLAALLADTRTFNGINVWIKPLKFQSSVAIFLATIALYWPLMDKADRENRLVHAAVWFVSLASLFEVAYITYRGSLAEASHYNISTPATALMYSLMGIAILATTAVSGWFGWLILRARDAVAKPDVRFAIGVGLIAGLILGSFPAIYMSSALSHWVGGVQNDANGSILFGWSRTGGDLRVAHFIGLHAMQGIPLIGFLATRFTPARTRSVVIAATVLWTLATMATFAQALMGRPFLPF
jgi:hypothetical protein